MPQSVHGYSVILVSPPSNTALSNSSPKIQNLKISLHNTLKHLNSNLQKALMCMLSHIHSSLTNTAVENSCLCGRAGSKLCGLNNGCLADGHSLWCRDCIACCISQDCWSLASLCSRLLLSHLVIARIKVLLLSSQIKVITYKKNRKLIFVHCVFYIWKIKLTYFLKAFFGDSC